MTLALTDTQNYSDIADAIRAKAGTEDTYTPAEMAQAIEDLPSGSGNPYPVRNDGKTHLWLNITDPLLSTKLYINAKVADGTTINWGDGSEIESAVYSSGYPTFNYHTYENAGLYEVILDAVNGELEIGYQDNAYGSCIMGYDYQGSNAPTRTNGRYLLQLVAAEIGGAVSLGTEAFCDCASLEYVTISSTASSVANGFKTNAFTNCSSLKSVSVIDDTGLGYNFIGNSAFANCASLESVPIPPSVNRISSNAFSNCGNLKRVEFSRPLAGSGSVPFEGCRSLEDIVLVEGAGVIPSLNSSAAMIRHFTVPNGVTEIPGSAFSSLKFLEDISLPPTLQIINSYAFYSCWSLLSVDIPEGVTAIKASAFDECRSLGSVVIPSTVTSIESRAFPSSVYDASGASKQYVIHCRAQTPPTLGSSMFGNNSDLTIYVPQGSLGAYQAATNWSACASRIQEEPAS